MGVLVIFVVVFAAAVAWGIRRRFNAVQWIWLLFGISALMLLFWLVLMVFVVGPNMRRMMQFTP
jgi:hypothetical protein